MSKSDPYFGMLSGAVVAFTAAYILIPFEKFEMTKRSVALSVAGFVGISIFAYCVVDNVIDDVLRDMTVVIDEKTICFRNPEGKDLVTLTGTLIINKTQNTN